MYKRQIDDIENIKPVEIYGSSTHGAYFSLNSFLEADKPYSGMYINKKVMLENVFETISLGTKMYSFQNFTTISEKFSNKEYICEIDLENLQYMYRCQNVTIKKNINFVDGTNILKIDYDIINENDERAKVSISPLVTYRDQIHMKKASYLKFGSREIENGILVNLSVVDNKNLALVCDGSQFIKVDSYVSNVKHEITNLQLKKDVYIEDLYLPGRFEVQLKPNETKKVTLLICDEVAELSNINNENRQDEIEKKKEINEEYVELKKLVNSLKFFENTAVISLPSNLYLNMENINEKNYLLYLSELLFEIQSIEGRYVCTNENDKALKKFDFCMSILSNSYEGMENNLIYLKCVMWLVENMYKFYLKESELFKEEYIEYIGRSVLLLENLNNINSEVFKDIEIVSLAFNTVKIYEEVLKDPTYESLAMDMSDKITSIFWDEQRRVLKKNADDMDPQANIDMIYAISLSFSPAKREIKTKVLDTIFRELYTPYGLRLTSKSSKTSDHLVYPKYMAHFISANLNQNGSTYASRKIAYNLIKDILMDIDKYVKDNVKYVYSEKGIDVDFKALDLYTTCEMIRLYSMFM